MDLSNSLVHPSDSRPAALPAAGLTWPLSHLHISPGFVLVGRPGLD